MEQTVVTISLSRIAAVCCLLGTLFFGSARGAAAARTTLNGSAAVTYTTYDAEAEGRSLFSGDSLAQQYSIAWGSTNLYYRDQPRYYSLMAGYDWTAYNTSITSAPGGDQEFKDSYGKFRYSGSIGYSPPTLPFRFKAFMADEALPLLRYDIYEDAALIGDGLVYDLEGRGTYASKGFTLDFYPDQATQQNLRGLPRIRIDYRETANKNEDRFSTTDRLTRETMASLGKGSNWFNYRRYETENNRDRSDKADQQQVQIGHIDFVGRRQWTGLTNWIVVSADGQLTTTNGAGRENSSEEYDVNFQAIASRRNWQARSFMNYNRILRSEELTEELRVPLYINGVWGPDTSWHASASTERGRQTATFLSPVEKSYSNTLTVGATLFLRSRFTLSPSLMLTTSKGYYGEDAYEAAVGLETASTSRFSNKLFINAGSLLRTRDDGYGTDESKTWSNQFTFIGKYLPSRNIFYELRQTVDVGNGSGYLDQRWQKVHSGASSPSGLQNYLRSLTMATVGYTGSAGFNAGISASYDLIMNSGLPDKTQTLMRSHASYRKDSVQFDLQMTYDHRDDGLGEDMTDVYAYMQLLYRPNRYHDGSMRYTLTKNTYSGGGERTRSDLVQEQTYRYFSRTGVAREIASITQGFSYINENDIVSKYFLLAGRYSPTARLTLNGSVKYYTDPSSVTLWYSAGVAADFRLLRASLDYSLAKRDRDDRTEKKLTASVMRSF